MGAAKVNVLIRRNEDYLMEWALLDEDGAPLDITGWTFVLDIQERLATIVVQSGEITVTDAANGQIQVLIEGGDLAPISLVGSPLQDVALRYDLLATDTDGIRRVLAYGFLIMSRGISE